MDKENSLAKDIEELVNKSIEANKIFLSESSRIVRQFTKPGEKKTPNIFQANFLTDAFNAYTKLNIQHLKNMVDLGVSMVKKVGVQPTTDREAKAESTKTYAPSFVLEAEAEAGSNISLSFLLDNIKQEAVLCNLVNSPYIFNADVLVEENFITGFSPQSFRLGTDEQQRIHIDIAIPATAKPGVYVSNVKVQGFEPAHFSIRLTVKDTPTKKAPHGRKKAGSK
jgi:hypothetical protein